MRRVKFLALIVAALLQPASATADVQGGAYLKDSAKQQGVVTSFVVNGFRQPVQDNRTDAQSVGSIQINFVPLGKGSETVGGVELDFQDISQEPRRLADSYVLPTGPVHIILPASQMDSIYRFLESNVPYSTAQVSLGFSFDDKHELQIKQSSFELYTTGVQGPLGTITVKKAEK